MKNNSHKIVYGELTPEVVKSQLANIKQITFEVTDACNLKCKYCTYGEFYEGYDHRENKMLSVEKAVRLLEYFVEFWDSDKNISEQQNIFISFYGGEPLMNMPFIEFIVDYVQNKLHAPNRFFRFSIATNGVLLDRYMDFLAKHRFSMLISLDGDVNHDAYRVDHNGNESFGRVIKNIKLLQEKHPKYFHDIVNFNAVLHNKNSVESIYRFFSEHFDKIPNIGVLNDNGIKPEMRQIFQETYRNSYESLSESIHCNAIEKDMFIKSGNYQNVTTFLHRYSGFVFRDYNELLYQQDEIHIIPTATCIPFSSRVFLTVNGKLLPCERIGQQHTLGMVTDDEVLIDFEEIATRYNKYYSKIIEQCMLCANQHACMQCIFNLDDLETTCKCHGFMNEEEFNQYVNTQMNFLKKHPEDYYRIMEEVIIE